MKMNRRDAVGMMAAFAMLSDAAGAQEAKPLVESQVFRLDTLPVKHGNERQETRAIVEGKTATGEAVEAHETTLLPGTVPHGPHRHPNSEFILVREGHLEYLTDGKAEKIGPGDAVLTASNVPHGLRAVGPGKTTYFIVSIGTKVQSTPVTLRPPA